MYIKNIPIFLFIIFYIQFTYSISKKEVLEIKDVFYISYYCKNDICVESPYDYVNPYIEFPEKNGNKTKYITYTCTYEEINLNNCLSEYCYNETCLPVTCNADIECLSNKCVNNHCTLGI
ncbi:hypothetical protein BCR32DRAFT_308520 [Anaeromyces robustus]|uniref:Uncharacterized protein n=1 Tax=Anaeromyces robustus TaxID=1754192 RepID=A0A1Y1XBP8_9FUNG|nr:hypothetical protein BCR32DRAFT_308520 [Anaeromyces robustus]|eukprot:ORX83211.1 hypothetical protein BCR32DRAFT_308520 [Anaeromyces robustus]